MFGKRMHVGDKCIEISNNNNYITITFLRKAARKVTKTEKALGKL